MPDPMQEVLAGDLLTGADGIVEKVNENFEARHGWDSATKTTTYTQDDDDEILIGDTTGGGFTITLLPAAQWANRSILIFKSVAANTLTIEGDSAETINGAANVALTAQYSYRRLFSTGTAVLVIGNE